MRTQTLACRGSGRVVIVASMTAFVAMAGFSTYAPTKFALRGLADALRSEVPGSSACASGVVVSQTGAEAALSPGALSPSHVRCRSAAWLAVQRGVRLLCIHRARLRVSQSRRGDYCG